MKYHRIIFQVSTNFNFLKCCNFFFCFVWKYLFFISVEFFFNFYRILIFKIYKIFFIIWNKKYFSSFFESLNFNCLKSCKFFSVLYKEIVLFYFCQFFLDNSFSKILSNLKKRGRVFSKLWPNFDFSKNYKFFSFLLC